ncbi:MAG: PQQ-binding-like beta-propeller repeat protein [Acidobacteriota bacterium]
MRRLVLVLAACGSRSAPTPPPPPVAAEPPVLRPQPGADLEGPIAVPAKTGPVAPRTPAPMIDLASDRVVVPVDVPAPPRGAAVTFAFGDDRTGWVTHIPDSVQMPALAYGEGRVYVSGGFESRTFYALDAGTGHVEWATQNLEDDGPTAPVFDDGRVIFNTESCTLFALDGKTGRRLWFRKIGDPTLAQTAVADGLVYASHPAPDGQQLSAYRVKDGGEVWSAWIGSELLAAPVIAGDAVYAATTAGATFRFARKTGKRAWAAPLGATTAPWVDGDELFVTRRQAGKEQQVVVDATTGKVVREHGKGSAPSRDVPHDIGNWKEVWAFEGSRPVVDRGVRYVALGGEIQASDAKSGEPLWRRRYAAKPDARSIGTVAFAGSAIVVSTRDGQVFALDVDTGYTLWSYALGHEVVAEPVIAKGWVYVTTRDGYVIALDVADPTLDGWHMFGGNPEHGGPVVPERGLL